MKVVDLSVVLYDGLVSFPSHPKVVFMIMLHMIFQNRDIVRVKDMRVKRLSCLTIVVHIWMLPIISLKMVGQLSKSLWRQQWGMPCW